MNLAGWRLALMGMSFVVCCSAAWGQDRIELRFFGRNGEELSYEQMRAVSNNGSAGYDNDCLVDPKSLHVLDGGRPIKNKDGRIWFELPDKRPVALAINWPSKPLGYSLVLLDNGGKGFSKACTVNFAYQASKDAMKALNKALSVRPGLALSASLASLVFEGRELVRRANEARSESERGRLGQLALDKVDEAYSLLLEESAFIESRKQTWLGVTFDTTEGYKENVNRTAQMANPYGWIRIVFDANTSPAVYKALVDYAHQKGLKILGQPVDSSYDKKYTVDQYLAFFKLFVEAFPQIDAWEVGNEVNGEWLTPQIAEKLSKAAAYCKQKGKTTLLTLFWQLNSCCPSNAIFNWCDTALDAKTRANLDYVTVSMYVEQGPMGLFFDRFMNQLHRAFPKQKLAIGELGYWIEGQRFWWAYDQTDPMGRAMRELCRHYYLASLGYAYSVGGCFWWNYLIEFKADPKLAEQVAAIRDRLIRQKP